MKRQEKGKTPGLNRQQPTLQVLELSVDVILRCLKHQRSMRFANITAEGHAAFSWRRSNEGMEREDNNHASGMGKGDNTLLCELRAEVLLKCLSISEV